MLAADASPNAVMTFNAVFNILFFPYKFQKALKNYN